MMFPLLFGGRKGGQTSQLHLSLINLSDGVEKCSFDKQEARRLRISTQGCQVAPGRGDAGGGGLWPGWRTCCGAGTQGDRLFTQSKVRLCPVCGGQNSQESCKVFIYRLESVLSSRISPES